MGGRWLGEYANLMIHALGVSISVLDAFLKKQKSGLFRDFRCYYMHERVDTCC